MVTAGIAVIATYAGVQYFFARHQVVADMAEKGMTVTNLHISSVGIGTDWSLYVWWTFNVNGKADEGWALATATSWLGLGWTNLPGLPGWNSL